MMRIDAWMVAALVALSGCNAVKSLLSQAEELSAEELPAADPSASATPTTGGGGSSATEAAAATGGALGTEEVEEEEPKPSNEEQVKRFDDEQKLEDALEQLVAANVVEVRQNPPKGNVLAVLKKNQNVDKLAERDGFSLVTFSNPEKPEELLMGWVETETLRAPPEEPAPAEKVDCGPGLTKFFSSPEFCAIACKTNAECPGGKTCSGSGKISVNAKAGTAAAFCKTGPAAPGASPPKNVTPPKEAPKNQPPKDPTPKKKKKKKKKKAD